MEERTTTFAARLRVLLDTLGLSPSEFAKMIGKNKGAVSCYLSGRYEAKQDTVYAISQRFGVSPAWLMGYDVPMYDADKIAQLPADVQAIVALCQSRPGLASALLNLARQMSKD